MMANLYDAIRENTYVLVAANSKKKPKAPEPMPRPAKKIKETKTKQPGGGMFAAMARMAYNAGRK